MSESGEAYVHVFDYSILWTLEEDSRVVGRKLGGTHLTGIYGERYIDICSHMYKLVDRL